MWAGVWIDVPRSESAAAHLREIAGTPPPVDPAAVHLRIVAASPTPAENAACRPPALEPRLGRPADGVLTDGQITGLVAARSSGHCEVMTSACTHGYDALESRTQGAVRTSADLFATCSACRTTLTTLTDDVCGHYGYRVAWPDALFDAPFFWRQAHWVLLRADGSMAPVRSPKAVRGLISKIC